MKKLFCVFLIFAMILSGFTYAFAEPTNADDIRAEFAKLVGEKELTKIEDKLVEAIDAMEGEKVSVIVELEDKPVLEEKKAETMGAANYLMTGEAANKIAKLESNQTKVQKAIKSVDSSAEFGYNFNLIINGFEAEVSAQKIRAISKLSGIKNIRENCKYLAPETKMVSSIDMVFPNLQGEQKFKGEGTAVAVIDTGIAAGNVLMRLSDGNAGKITQADVANVVESLNAAADPEKPDAEPLTAADFYYSAKVPFQFDYTDYEADATTDKTEGGSEHGVHVSGTIGANKIGLTDADLAKLDGVAINGVAPETQILGMKVFDADGAAYDEWIFAAVEDAITLGADAINLSLGSSCGFTLTDGDEPNEMAQVFERARNAGVVVAVAASNDNRTGESGLNVYGSEDPLAANPDSATVGDPSTKKFATTVASFENDNVVTSYFKHNGKDIKGFSVTYPESGFTGSFDAAADGNVFVDCGTGKVAEFTDALKAEVNGKIALIQRGGITFSEKSYNAAQAGAVACVIYNNQPGNLGITMVGGTKPDGTPITNADVIPTLGILQADGEAIKAAIDQPVDAKGYFGSLPSEESGMMSSFSSWGATPDLKLKPEILAPGGQIYSTISDNQFTSMSGTSMATPHVAGGAAVVRNYLNSRQYSSNLAKVTQVSEALMMSTAVPQINSENNVYFSPRQQGAGLMNLTAATQGITYILNEDTQKAKVELGDKLAAGTPKTFTFTIYNDEAEERTYTLSGNVLIEDSYDKSGTTFIANTMNQLSASKVTFDSDTVTVPANGTKTVTATLTLDASEMAAQSEKFENGFFVEGFVKLTADELTATYPNLGIPYMGFYGNWDAAPLFDKLAYGEDAEENGYPFFLNTKLYSVDGVSFYDFSTFLYGVGLELNMATLGEDYTGEMSGSQYVAISPADYDAGGFFNMYQSRDFAYFSVDMLRNAKEVTFTVEDSNGKQVSDHVSVLDSDNEITGGTYFRKSFYYSGIDAILPGICSFLDTGTAFRGWDTVYWDGTDTDGNLVEDGQYYIVVSGKIDYEGARTDSIKLPVRVDNVKPIAAKFLTKDASGATESVEVMASDDYYLDYVEGTYDFEYEDYGDPAIETIVLPIKGLQFAKEGTVTFNNEDLEAAKEAALEEYEDYFDQDADTQARLEKEISELTLDQLKYNAVDSAANRGEAEEKIMITAKSATADAKVYDGTTKATVSNIEFEPSEYTATKAAGAIGKVAASLKQTLGDPANPADPANPDTNLVEGTDYTVNAEFEQADVGEDIPVSFEIKLIENEKTKMLFLKNEVEGLTADITPKALTVESFGIKNKEYDGTTDAEVTDVILKGALEPLEMGKDFEATAVFDSPNASKDAPVTLTIKSLNPNYTIESPVTGGAAIITPKEVEVDTITVADKVYDGTTDAEVTAATLNGTLEPQTLGKDFEATAVFDSPNAAKDAPATVTLTSKNPNYVIKSPVKTTATIAPMELTLVSAKVDDKTYDGKTSGTVSNVEFDPKADLKAGTDYDAVATFKSPDANKEAVAVVTVNMKNTNYVVKNPLEVKAVINKADRECPLKYTVDVKDGKYTITIEPVEGAEYNFGNGWTKSNVFVTEKSGKLTLSIRLPEDTNYNEAKSEVTVKLTPEGAVETGDSTQIVLWVVLMAAAVAVGAGAYIKKTKKAEK